MKEKLKLEALKKNPWVSLVALLAVYKIHFVYYFYFLPTGFHNSYMEKLHLSSFVFPDIYNNSSFIIAACKNIFLVTPVLLTAILLFVFRKQTAWNSVDSDLLKPTKYFILFIVLFTTWYFALSGYNYYYDRPYYFDRIFIALMCVLLFRFTWSMPIFIGATMLWLSQTNYPLEAGSLTDKKIVYEILFLFLSYLIVKIIFEIRVTALWVGIFAVIAANYFIPAVGKFQIGPTWYQWILENELWTLLQNAFSNNWLGFLSEEQRHSLLITTQKFNFTLLLYTLIVEFFFIFILFRRKLTIVLLSLIVILHIGIFVAAGVFFWKWILFDLALIVLLIYYKQPFNSVFTKKNFITSVFIIILSPWIFQPVKLAWWDNRYSTVMKYEVTDSNNQKFILSGNQMHPYEQAFTFQRFYYLIPDSIPSIINISTDYELFHSLRMIKTKDVKDWIEKNKKTNYNEEKVRLFDKFITTFFENYNRHAEKKDVFNTSLSAPAHIWTSKYPNNLFPDDRPVKSFKVKFYQYYQDEEKLSLMNEGIIYEKQFFRYKND